MAPNCRRITIIEPCLYSEATPMTIPGFTAECAFSAPPRPSPNNRDYPGRVIPAGLAAHETRGLARLIPALLPPDAPGFWGCISDCVDERGCAPRDAGCREACRRMCVSSAEPPPPPPPRPLTPYQKCAIAYWACVAGCQFSYPWNVPCTAACIVARQVCP